MSTLLNITLNNDDGLANLRCAKCKQIAESLKTVMMDLTKFNRSVATCMLQSELSLHAIIVS